jgi:hypothetical protein
MLPRLFYRVADARFFHNSRQRERIAGWDYDRRCSSPTNGSTGQILFSNRTSNPAFGGPVSGGNASPGLEAIGGSNLGGASVTLQSNASGNGMLSARLELDGMPGNFAIAVGMRKHRTPQLWR